MEVNFEETFCFENSHIRNTMTFDFTPLLNLI